VDERKESVVLRSGGILSEAVAWSWMVPSAAKPLLDARGGAILLIVRDNLKIPIYIDDSANTANHIPR
jgi:hypothetical protein